jgi:hypothetical protein
MVKGARQCMSLETALHVRELIELCCIIRYMEMNVLLGLQLVYRLRIADLCQSV